VYFARPTIAIAKIRDYSQSTSVSVRFSARSMHFSLFWPRENWGGRLSRLPSPVAHFFALAPIFARLKNKKCLERAENLTETLATQAKKLGDKGPDQTTTSLFYFLAPAISPLLLIWIAEMYRLFG